MQTTKVAAIIVAAAMALGVCTIADAKTTTTAKHTGVHGVILGVQSANSQITVRIGSAKKNDLRTITIVIGPSVTIEGKGKKGASESFSSLHGGDHIIIEPDTTNPTTIVNLGGAHKGKTRKV